MIDTQLLAETVGKLQEILDQLRRNVGAGRTTLRLDHKALGFSVNTPAAESLAEGVHSIKHYNTLDQWNGAAIKWMALNKRTFIMNDCRNPSDPKVAPHRDVVEIYGILSEMLTPLIMDANMLGWVSVHYTKGSRKWTEDEIKMIESACDRVRSVLEALDEVSSGDSQ